jgi:hypothetical protein
MVIEISLYYDVRSKKHKKEGVILKPEIKLLFFSEHTKWPVVY